MRKFTFRNHAQLVRDLRRSLEALVPYTDHKLDCASRTRHQAACSCGLAQRLAAAQRVCTPKTPPPIADYAPPRYG